MTDHDKSIMEEHEASVKDMEVMCYGRLQTACIPCVRALFTGILWFLLLQAAAIAWVTGYAKVPFIAVKAVTDIVDGDRPTQEEFLENLHTAAQSLQEAVPKVLGAIADGVLTEA